MLPSGSRSVCPVVRSGCQRSDGQTSEPLNGGNVNLRPRRGAAGLQPHTFTLLRLSEPPFLFHLLTVNIKIPRELWSFGVFNQKSSNSLRSYFEIRKN